MEWSTSKRVEATLHEGSRGRVHLQVLPVATCFVTEAHKYLQIWIRRLPVLRKHIIDACMDTFQADPPENQEFQVALQAETAQLQADGLVMQQPPGQASVQPVPLVLFTMQ